MHGCGVAGGKGGGNDGGGLDGGGVGGAQGGCEGGGKPGGGSGGDEGEEQEGSSMETGLPSATLAALQLCTPSGSPSQARTLILVLPHSSTACSTSSWSVSDMEGDTNVIVSGAAEGAPVGAKVVS